MVIMKLLRPRRKREKLNLSFPFTSIVNISMSEKQGTAIPGAGINGRPIVFFDISIGDQPAGRIKMELFNDIVPK